MSAPSQVAVDITVPDDAALTAAVEDLVHARVASKLTAQDPTLWGPDAESEAKIRLSWVSLAETSRPLVPQITALRDELRAEGLTRVVLAGMGGSSLAPEVICATRGVELVTLDTTDPGQVRAALADRLAETVLVVSSKSGGTVETDSHRRVFAQAFSDAGLDPRQHIVVVTDPGSPFTELAAKEGYRAVFLADPNVGGRYSALTAFGLVPAGLAGVDLDGLLDEAAAVSTTLAADDAQNPALVIGALLGLAQTAGAEKLVLADTGSGIVGFGDWAEQLIAESTGKQGTGILPVVVESPQAPGFADAGPDAVLASLGSPAGVTPASGFAFAVAGPLGAQMLLWEYAVAIAGRQLGIDPFDQPDVESAKKATRKLLADSDSAGSDDSPTAIEGPEFEGVTVLAGTQFADGADSLAEVLQRFLAAAPELGYVSIQAYLDRLGDDAARLRPLVATRTGLQTTFGWGPRFLHSTGQYHKGGHANGVFLQILGAPTGDDLDIPEQPFSFAALQLAQARGDGSVLADHDRPVLSLYLSDRAVGLDTLAALLGSADSDGAADSRRTVS